MSQPVLAILVLLQTPISTTILQTDIINMNKQLINAISQSSYKCAETLELNFFHGHTMIHIYIYIYTTLTFLGKHVIQTNPSKFDERLFSDIYICADYVSNREEKYRILCFEAVGVPEGRSSEGYASFKQVKPWPWHVEVILGVGVVGLVTNKELCQVIWGIIIKNFMHKYSFIVSEKGFGL